MNKVLLSVITLLMLTMCFVVIAADGDHHEEPVIKITVGSPPVEKTGDVVICLDETIAVGLQDGYTGGTWNHTFNGDLRTGMPIFSDAGVYNITVDHATDDPVVSDPNQFYEDSRKVTVVKVDDITAPETYQTESICLDDVVTYTAVSSSAAEGFPGDITWVITGGTIVGSSTGTSVQVEWDTVSSTVGDKILRAYCGTNYHEITLTVYHMRWEIVPVLNEILNLSEGGRLTAKNWTTFKAIVEPGSGTPNYELESFEKDDPLAIGTEPIVTDEADGGKIKAGSLTGEASIVATYTVDGYEVCRAEPVQVDVIGCNSCVEEGCELPGTLTTSVSGGGIGKGGYSGNSGKTIGVTNIGDGKNGKFTLELENLSQSPKRKLIVYKKQSANAEVIEDADGIRQVLSEKAFFDFEDLTAYKTKISVYNLNDVSQNKSNGVYALSGQPMCFIEISNPDEAAGNSKMLIKNSQESGVSYEQFTYNVNTEEWKLARDYDPDSDSSPKWESTVTVTNADGDLIDTNIIEDSSGSILSKMVKTYRNLDFGTVLISEQNDPDGQNITTDYEYYEYDTAIGYGKVKQMVSSTGSWTRYEYDSEGRVIRVVSPFANSLITDANSSSRVTEYDYTPLSGSQDDGSFNPDAVRRETNFVLGSEVSRSYSEYLENETRQYRAIVTGSAWNSGDTLMTTTKYIASGNHSGKITSVENPNGTMTFYLYEEDVEGNLITTQKSGAPNAGKTYVVSGTSRVTTENSESFFVSSVTTDIESGLVIASRTVTERDSLGRAERTEYLDGTFEVKAFACCGLSSERDRDGVVTTYDYDGLKRQDSVTRAGVTQFSVLDALGRTTVSQTIGKSGNIFVNSVNEYNIAGELVQQTNASGNATLFATTYNSDGSTEQRTTFPDGTYQTSFSYRDGGQYLSSGNAIYPVFTEFGVEADSTFGVVQFTKTYQGLDNTATQWSKTYSDPLGRSYKTELADGTIMSRSHFNSLGQLERTVSGNVTTMFVYNSRGEQIGSVVDMDDDDTIDLNGTDRIVENESDYTTYNGETVRRSRSYSYETAGSGVRTLKSTSYQSLTSLESWSDVHGLVTHSLTTLDGLGGKIVTVTLADGSSSITNSVNNLVNWSKRLDSSDVQISRTDHGYDDFNRLEVSADARNGVTEIEYDNLGRAWRVTAPAPDSTVNGDIQVTETYFDVMGRTECRVNPDATEVYFTYHLTGELLRTWGSKTYPVEYTYDRGRMKTMTTWQNFAGDTGKAVTTWNYDSQRGWLTSKVYADGKGTTYNYYAVSGQLKTRTWHRGVSTIYSYTDAGELNNINYSDNTTDIDYTYLRDGRRNTITDDSGARKFAYTPEGQLYTETQTSGVLGGAIVKYDYDSLLRKDNLNISGNGIFTINHDYTYDDASRLETVGNGTQSVTYTRHANSDLINTKTYESGGTVVMTTTQVFDKLNRLTSTTTRNALDNILKSHSYEMNLANQRTRVDLNDGNHWDYQYDDLGQVELAQKQTASNSTINSFDFHYTFDDIGNRDNDLSNSGNIQYIPNLVNQYTNITGKSGITHDDDGSMTNDGTWEMAYNAENRLIEMSKTGQTLKFYYDYMGRRWKKEVYDNGTLSETKLFIYDGWNLVAELDGAEVLFKSYMWGLDLSDSEQGAGGVGGLISMSVHSTGFDYLYVFDGNGNTTALVDANTGAVSHSYEYGPFGKIIAGDNDGANQFRFSTKYEDLESGNLYYGFRYYHPQIGRWLSRDPIEEKGGINVYIFVKNNSVMLFDILGLAWEKDEENFKTEVTLRGFPSKFTFKAKLEWETWKNSKKEDCDFKNLAFTMYGDETVTLKNGGTDYYVRVEVEGFTRGDFMEIGATKITGTEYGAATGGWRPRWAGTTTTTTVGGVSVDWTWKDIPQPTKILIKGTGKKIEINHTSPNVIVRSVQKEVGGRRVNATVAERRALGIEISKRHTWEIKFTKTATGIR